MSGATVGGIPLPMFVPFNQPSIVGQELEYVREAIDGRHLSGNGKFTKRCQAWLESNCRSPRALLTHSATAALEMAALLLELAPGDEVIMPSFTFVSTANAVVLRGGVPVFVDVRRDTLNLDEAMIEGAITDRTRAIFVVHYAGISCEMESIMTIARAHGIPVVEDAAQGLGSTYSEKPLGSIGDMAALSFHETKNIISGEGGALLVNDAALTRPAEIIWEKGTDRSAFQRGEVDKYTWRDVGSSYLPSEMVAAFLWAQLENAHRITPDRTRTWNAYFDGFADLEAIGLVRRPVVPVACEANGHLFYLILHADIDRARVLRTLRDRGVHALFHYVPLHSSAAGLRYGRLEGALDVTDDLSARLIRLPLWFGLTQAQIDYVIETTHDVITSAAAG